MTMQRTSLAAFAAVRPRISERRAAVMACLLRHPHGLTSDQVASILGWPADSVRPRFTELADIGAIYSTGERRLTRAGRANLATGRRGTTAMVYAVRKGNGNG